jgi:hypothetical protein
MKNTAAIISDRPTLEELQRQADRSWRARYRKIQIAFQGLPDDENHSWQSKIEKWYYACGCGEATVTGLVGLAAFGASLFLQQGGIRAFTLWDIPLTVLVFIAATGLGKVVGLVRARLNLIKTLDEFEAELVQRKIIKPEQPPAEDETASPLCAVD